MVAFSCSLVPAFINPAFAVDGNGKYMYLYASLPTIDALYQSKGYPVSSYAYGQCYSFDPTSTNLTYNMGFDTGYFQPIGNDCTLYVCFSCTTDRHVNYSSLTKSIAVQQYNVSAGSLTSSHASLVTQNKPGTGHILNIAYRIPVHADAARLVMPSNSDGGAHFVTVEAGHYAFGFSYAYIVNSQDDALLNYLDSIIRSLSEINAELDTQTTILNSCVAYLNNVDSNVSSIYDLLHNALSQESTEMDSKSKAVAESVMQQDNAEQYWNDKNQENFNAIGLDNFSFGDGVVSGLGTVGGLFQGLWDSLADAVIIYVFPLVLGLSLVVIGRISRSSGKGGKGKHDGGE